MEPLRIADDIIWRPFVESDVAELRAVVVENREHLARWMPWAVDYRREDAAEFVAGQVARAGTDDGFLEGAIVMDGRIVGVAGFHSIDRVNRSTSIGYWLAAPLEGRGLMTATVRALLDLAFGAWGVHRVVIEAVVDNARSRAIPERLGFTEEAVLREAKLLGGRHEDAVLYAMLASDWSKAPAREATGSA